MRVKVSDPRFDVKERYDTAFDKLFFTSDFKFSWVHEFKFCPEGTTFDTCFEEDSDVPYFVLVSKRYGYDFSSFDRVVGDYELRNYDFTEEMIDFALNYLKEKNPQLYEEVKDMKFYYWQLNRKLSIRDTLGQFEQYGKSRTNTPQDLGHSSNGDITSNYIGTYPLAKMLEYNSYLLNENGPADDKTALINLLKGMSEEERAALMAEASK